MDKIIGIIGGSGVYDENDMTDKENVKMSTPYGAPSGPITVGNLYGRRVAFLPRHGPGHTIPPHKVNYRANIWAMKELGVERIITVSAVGSLQENFKPGEIVICDQYIDFTKNRKYTYFDGGKTYHISMADPFCPDLMDIFTKKADKLGLQYHGSGVYMCIEGPRFSTRAESKMFRAYADVIGMTLVPEVQLAREMGMCYVTIAMITDYDVWADKPVDVNDIMETMNLNINNVKMLLKEAIPEIRNERVCQCAHSLDNAEV